VGNLTAKDSGEVLTQQSSVPYDALIDALKQAGIHDDYIKGDALADAQNVANALASHQKLKSEEKAAENVAPDHYDFALTDDTIQHPDGHKWNPGQDDPDFVKEISDIFRTAGLDQATASKLTNAFARHGVKKLQAGKANQQKAAQAYQAEMAKLGPDGGKERMSAIDQYISANHGGPEAVDAMKSGGNARQVEIIEELIAQANGAGRGASKRGNNVPAKPDLSGLSGYEHVQRAFGHSKG
jgi:hypothetical protein